MSIRLGLAREITLEGPADRWRRRSVGSRVEWNTSCGFDPRPFRMVSVRKAQKKAERWQRYFLRTVKPLTGERNRTGKAEYRAWIQEGNARIRNRRRRGELAAD